MEDREKVLDKLNELNKGLKEPLWGAAPGFNMLPAVSYDSATKGFNSTIDKGISVKIFANVKTGETKIFWAEHFMKREQ